MKTTYLAFLTLALWLTPVTGEAKARWPKAVTDCAKYQSKYCKNLLCLCYVGTNNPKESLEPINISAVEACNAQFNTCVASGEAEVDHSQTSFSSHVDTDDPRIEK